MAWPEPKYSKSRVRKAGKVISKHQRSANLFERTENRLSSLREEYKILEDWRASHGAVLNTAQAWLRRQKISRGGLVVGQRLKQSKTIEDKLIQGRSRDLSTMNDIAGLRLIVEDMDCLEEIRQRLMKSRARHKLVHVDDPDKFNYVKKPKRDGYRDIHLVYERLVQGISGEPWNGLRFEIQLRTKVQHSWATAVELYDKIERTRFKFEPSNNAAYEQFQIISEIFARIYEDSSGPFPDLKLEALHTRFMELEASTKLRQVFGGLRVVEKTDNIKENTILEIQESGDLLLHNFPSFSSALEALETIENQTETISAVLVGGDVPNHIRQVFQNYFDDGEDFMYFLDSGLKEIKAN